MSGWPKLWRVLGALGWVTCLLGVGGLLAGRGLPAAAAAAVGFVAGQLLLIQFRPVRIPVVMLHSVVGERSDRPKSFPIWCPPPMFEGYLKYLQRKGYHTITLTELHHHLAHGGPLPPKPIVLTFDDGYLDNWVYAAPLLKKYGFTGTVFVPSDFIEPNDTPRPTLEDVWAGRLTEDELVAFGFLNRGEIRALAQSGVMDIQSHGQTHTWLPFSADVIDYHRPGLRYRHLRPLWWNRFPARKPFWFQEIDEAALPFGIPIYRNDLALARRRYVPDPGLEQELTAFVGRSGGREFFDRSIWRQELDAVVADYRRRQGVGGEFESDEAFRERLRTELQMSRETLEALTGKPVRFMCWPNGGVCPEAYALLERTGYLAATLPSRAKQPHNLRGSNPARVGRVSATSFFRGTQRVGPWVASFALKVERNRGNLYMELPIKAIWLYRRFVRPSGARPPGHED